MPGNRVGFVPSDAVADRASAVRSARGLYASMHQSEFVVGLMILENLAGLLLPVLQKLQAVKNDLTETVKDVTEVLSAQENNTHKQDFRRG